MKVKYIQVARLLNIPAGTISMALKRGSLNKTLDGRIDLDDVINHAWICKRLLKLPQYAQQGCEIPQDISALFKATPITENEKNKNKNGVIKAPPEPLEIPPDESDTPAPDDPAAAARNKNAIEMTETQRTKDKANAELAVAKAELEKVKVAEARRELIKIKPYARLLFNIVSASRIQIDNAIPNAAQKLLDDIKSALKDNKTDTEIIMMIQDAWRAELNPIYISIDRELKSKIRQAKNELMVTDGHEGESDEGLNDAA